MIDLRNFESRNELRHPDNEKEITMTRMLCTAVLVSFFIGATALTSLAASEQTSHHPADAQSASSSPGMMMQGAGMNSMPCMVVPSSESGTQMMGMMGQGMGDRMGRDGMHGMMGGGGMHGMMNGGQMHKMEQDMRSMLYLDRAADLGLSAEQISRLKAIHLDCRKENIRTAAEAKIARLEMSALLSADNWTLKDAEPLVRKLQKLEGDIQVRHLQAVSDARQVLTVEQLQQVNAAGSAENLEGLFE